MNRLALILERPENVGWRKQKNTLPPKQKKPDPMTQIIGIICKDSIVMASESQYTMGSTKLLNAKKISVIKFKMGSAIVAEAGIANFSSKAVRYMNEAAKNKEMENEYDFVKIAEDAIKRIRIEILSSMQQRIYSVSEQNEIFSSEENRFGLMIAYYFKPKNQDGSTIPKPIPCLYTISLSNPQPEPHYPIAVLGIAETVATYILRQFKCEDLQFVGALSLAIDAVDRINNSDIYCGGQIKTAFLNPEFHVAGMFDDVFVNRALEKLRTVRKNNELRYKAELETVMRQIDNEDLEDFLKKEKEQHDEWMEKCRVNNPITAMSVPSSSQIITPDEKI